jgi:hypothetical protein
MLRFDSLRAAALANLFFFILDFRKEINYTAVVSFKVRGLRLHAGFQDGRSHRADLAQGFPPARSSSVARQPNQYTVRRKILRVRRRAPVY